MKCGLAMFGKQLFVDRTKWAGTRHSGASPRTFPYQAVGGHRRRDCESRYLLHLVSGLLRALPVSSFHRDDDAGCSRDGADGNCRLRQSWSGQRNAVLGFRADGDRSRCLRRRLLALGQLDRAAGCRGSLRAVSPPRPLTVTPNLSHRLSLTNRLIFAASFMSLRRK